GALPVVIPILDDRATVTEYLNHLDGLMFTGGEDIPPQAYGQQKHPATVEVHPRRFAHDQLLAEAVLQREIPVLAICMGLQLVNVVYGGTLIQDIQTDIRHTPLDPGNDSHHSIVLEEENLLHQILGATDIEVNSAHHQAVEKLAPGMRVLAQAPDGIVEAVQMTDWDFFLGVQWHPERIVERPEQRRIFEAFVNACQRGS
ncbi:MAG: gamma-glutamyl-gamma-aminobutyrate hydrolase family protein, partial [Anaerolineae bacterium]|nr:gamma-glutamyl-gamma-aminobutyrate hydrolase family protein [Anaerolineae bacterium]